MVAFTDFQGKTNDTNRPTDPHRSRLAVLSTQAVVINGVIDAGLKVRVRRFTLEVKRPSNTGYFEKKKRYFCWDL